MEFPEVISFDASDDEADAAHDLIRLLADLAIREPFVVSSVHGERLARAIDGRRASGTPPDVLDQAWASEVGSQAHQAGADAVVAIGGGRVLDIGKLAAARAGIPVIVVPTQLS
ncbi:MAG: Iron-containing alcohol dehydrogenase, partial [Actinomycetota bacterium]|nr:Iron-containing alcohol dehydrogenase [Actinomycetota bacterium]